MPSPQEPRPTGESFYFPDGIVVEPRPLTIAAINTAMARLFGAAGQRAARGESRRAIQENVARARGGLPAVAALRRAAGGNRTSPERQTGSSSGGGHSAGGDIGRASGSGPRGSSGIPGRGDGPAGLRAEPRARFEPGAAQPGLASGRTFGIDSSTYADWIRNTESVRAVELSDFSSGVNSVARGDAEASLGDISLRGPGAGCASPNCQICAERERLRNARNAEIDAELRYPREYMARYVALPATRAAWLDQGFSYREQEPKVPTQPSVEYNISITWEVPVEALYCNDGEDVVDGMSLAEGFLVLALKGLGVDTVRVKRDSYCQASRAAYEMQATYTFQLKASLEALALIVNNTMRSPFLPPGDIRISETGWGGTTYSGDMKVGVWDDWRLNIRHDWSSSSRRLASWLQSVERVGDWPLIVETAPDQLFIAPRD